MPEALKNIFFSKAFYDDLASALRAAYPSFDKDNFLALIYDENWEERKLKERLIHTSEVVAKMLPPDYGEALDILHKVAPSIKDYGFESIFLSHFASSYGLDDWEVSIQAMEKFTQQGSAEFAVRFFILKDQERMMAQMLEWAEHEHEEVRRLASEGCRPLLPWAMALPTLKADPTPILPILDKLCCDESEYVRRSVANNINDIAKDNPHIVIDTLDKWQVHDTKDMKRLTHHALRTLTKAGHPDALRLLGFNNQPEIKITNFIFDKQSVAKGESITFSCDITSTSDKTQELMIDYVVHFMRSNGKQSQKVFKLSKRTLKTKETVSITRQQSFKPISTRKYYAGEHFIELQINGLRFGKLSFMLTD